MFPDSLQESLHKFALLAAPHVARLDLCFRRRIKSAWSRPYDPLQLKALLQVTPGAAARLLATGHPLAAFLEQTAYNSRRLAKLNVVPAEVVDALREYDQLLDPLLANTHPEIGAALEPARLQLHFCTVLSVQDAFYQVRESETQAFYGLLRAELEAADLDELLRRFIAILTRTFRAQAGRLIPVPEKSGLSSQTLKRLAWPRYIACGSPEEELILDPAMRARHASYWSVPYFASGRLAGLLQFGFRTPYRWLPRELELLNGFAERCLLAAERTRMEQILAAREEQVSSLAAHLLRAEEEERRRISRELHDEAGQSLLFLRLHLEMMEKLAGPDLAPCLAEAGRVAGNVITEVRRIIADLNPSVLEQLGLAAAIRQMSAQFRKACPVKLRVRLSAGGARLSPEAEAIVYRVVQESYQNIARHSQAKNVNVSFHSSDKLVELNVEDDGIGFQVDAAVSQPNSFGLKGMRERVALLGGHLEIHSAPGHGAKIRVTLPSPSRSNGGAAESQMGG